MGNNTGKGKGINVKVTVDSKPFEKLEKTLSKLDKQISGLGKDISKQITQNTKYSQSTKQAEKSFDNWSNNIKRNRRTHDEHEMSIRNTSDALDKNVKMTDLLNASVSGSIRPITKMKNSYHSLIGTIERFIPLGIGLHFGIGNIVHESHRANMETVDWLKNLAQLSNTTGDASGALGQMFEIFSMSKGSLATIQQNMLSLGAQGIKPTISGFKELVAMVTNISIATGIGAESFSSFSGILVRNWQYGVKATFEMTSSLIAMQKAFDSTANEIELTMKTTGDSIEKMASFFDDGVKSAKSLTKGVAMTVGVLTKLGVSAQKANEFVGNLLDPEKMSENIVLFSRMGISYGEMMDMMSSSNSKDLVFDKLLQNLPVVAQQIQSIANPMARMNFAKSIGLPMEIAQKMSKATTQDIQKLMLDYKQASEKDKALKEKQEKMAFESQRFEDTLHMFKRDALGPMMEWVNANYKDFMSIAQIAFSIFKKYVGGLVDFFNLVEEKMKPAFDAFKGGAGFDVFMSKLVDGLLGVAGQIFVKVGSFLINNIPVVATNIFKTWLLLWKEHPLLTSVATLIGVMKVYSKVVGTISDFKNAFMKQGSNRARPLFVKEVSNGLGGKDGGFGGLSGLLKKIPGVGKLGKLGNAMGSLSKLAGPLSKAAWYLAPIIGGITGAMNAEDYFKKENAGAEVNAKQKRASIAAGAGTLGIAPLIDSMFGTDLTGGLARSMVSGLNWKEEKEKNKLSGKTDLVSQARMGELVEKETTTGMGRFFGSIGNFYGNVAKRGGQGMLAGSVGGFGGAALGAQMGALYGAMEQIPLNELHEKMLIQKEMSKQETDELAILEEKYASGKQLNEAEEKRMKSLQELKMYGMNQEELQLKAKVEKRIEQLRSSGKKEDAMLADQLQEQLNKKYKYLKKDIEVSDRMAGYLGKMFSKMGIFDTDMEGIAKTQKALSNLKNDFYDIFQQIGFYIKKWVADFKSTFSFNVKIGDTIIGVGFSKEEAEKAKQESQGYANLLDNSVMADIFSDVQNIPQLEQMLKDRKNQILQAGGENEASRGRISMLEDFANTQRTYLQMMEQDKKAKAEKIRQAQLQEEALKNSQKQTNAMGGIAKDVNAIKDNTDKQKSGTANVDWISAFIGSREAFRIA